MTRPAAIDWYENRHKLEQGMIFHTREGITVKLDRRVPGDGSKWYVETVHNGKWFNEDFTIEPGDLLEKLPD